MNTSPELMTKAAFAKEMGFSHVYVKKLEDMGRLRMVEVVGRAYPKVDVVASKKLIAETADPTRADVKERWQKTKAAQNEPKTPLEDDEEEAHEIPQGETFASARARKMTADADLSELTLRQKSGELVLKDDIEKMAGDAASVIRQGLERLPEQLAVPLAVETKEQAIRELLNEYCEDLLQQLAATIEKSLSAVH